MTPAQALDRCRKNGRLSPDGWLALREPLDFLVDDHVIKGSITTILVNWNTKEWTASLMRWGKNLSEPIPAAVGWCDVKFRGKDLWYRGQAFATTKANDLVPEEPAEITTFEGDGPLDIIPPGGR